MDISNLDPTKVIVRFFIDMQTIEFDKSISTLENLISKNSAYIENFMNEAGSVGKVTHKEERKI